MLPDYFPLTPAPAMAGQGDPPIPAAHPASAPPSRVTLHLGHLPDKKVIKAPWPRTPSRVRAIRLPFLFIVDPPHPGRPKQSPLARISRLP